MKFKFFLIPCLLAVFSCSPVSSEEIKEGDIIFHTSLSSQSEALQIATNSKYTHMGIILQRSGEFYVLEAVGPVKFTPFKEWVARGKGGHYVVKRLKNASEVLTVDALNKLKVEANSFVGRPYDWYFEWSDDRLYCSELVWKIYDRSLGIKIGELSKLGEFHLSHPKVKAKLAERYGSKVPIEEIVISPSEMYHSPLLVTVINE